jgi:hypothetical protein
MDPLGAPSKPETLRVPAEFQPLFKYLKNRFADTVVLRFSEIEDLLGAALPPDARLSEAWWLPPGGSRAPSEASRAWRQANRSAIPNLAARTVTFDRGRT